jgi:hypothetical protein
LLSGRGDKLGTHGMKVDGVSLLITVFDMSNLPQATGASGADGSGGTVGVPNLPDTDPRSLAAKTRLRLLCYDPKNNATGTLIIDAKTTLQVPHRACEYIRGPSARKRACEGHALTLT